MFAPRTNPRIAAKFLLVACLVILVDYAPSSSAQQIIDRMVAVVDGEVVTQGDIENFRLLGDLFGDSVPEADSDVITQLVENILIARRIAQSPSVPITDAEIDAYLSQFADSPDLPLDVRLEAARARLERARWFDSIRRPLRAAPEELIARYEGEFVPQLRALGAEVIPPLFQVEEELREIVITDKLNTAIEARVEGLYRRFQVELVD